MVELVQNVFAKSQFKSSPSEVFQTIVRFITTLSHPFVLKGNNQKSLFL